MFSSRRLRVAVIVLIVFGCVVVAMVVVDRRNAGRHAVLTNGRLIVSRLRDIEDGEQRLPDVVDDRGHTWRTRIIEAIGPNGTQPINASIFGLIKGDGTSITLFFALLNEQGDWIAADADKLNAPVLLVVWDESNIPWDHAIDIRLTKTGFVLGSGNQARQIDLGGATCFRWTGEVDTVPHGVSDALASFVLSRPNTEGNASSRR